MPTETVTPQEKTIRQATLHGLTQALHIVQAVPMDRPKASYVGAIEAFIKGRYAEESPTPSTDSITTDSITTIITLAEELLYAIDIPEKHCSCHINPPCGDCVEFSGLRAITTELQQAIIAYRGY